MSAPPPLKTWTVCGSRGTGLGNTVMMRLLGCWGPWAGVSPVAFDLSVSVVHCLVGRSHCKPVDTQCDLSPSHCPPRAGPLKPISLSVSAVSVCAGAPLLFRCLLSSVFSFQSVRWSLSYTECWLLQKSS